MATPPQAPKPRIQRLADELQSRLNRRRLPFTDNLLPDLLLEIRALDRDGLVAPEFAHLVEPGYFGSRADAEYRAKNKPPEPKAPVTYRQHQVLMCLRDDLENARSATSQRRGEQVAALDRLMNSYPVPPEPEVRSTPTLGEVLQELSRVQARLSSLEDENARLRGDGR